MPNVLPRIAWDSVLPAATLTATPAPTESDGALARCTDWLPWTFWRPVDHSDVVVVAELAGTRSVTAFAIAGHDCTGTVAMDWWNGAAWVEFATTEAAGDGAVIYLVGAAVSTTRLRFRFDALSFLAILWAGADLELPMGVAPGWSDPVLAQRAKTTTETSRAGVWLGTAVELWDADLSLSVKSVAATWVRDRWLPFLRACSTRPFFLTWNAEEWPASACLCSAATFEPTPFSSNGFIDVGVSFNADTGYDRRLTP